MEYSHHNNCNVLANSIVSVFFGSVSIDWIFSFWAVFSCFFRCLIIFDWVLQIAHAIILLGAGYLKKYTADTVKCFFLSFGGWDHRTEFSKRLIFPNSWRKIFLWCPLNRRFSFWYLGAGTMPGLSRASSLFPAPSFTWFFPWAQAMRFSHIHALIGDWACVLNGDFLQTSGAFFLCGFLSSCVLPYHLRPL